MTITLRQESDARASTKGTSLTFQELDNNFIDILNRSEITFESDSGEAQLSTAATDDRRLVINGAGGLTTAITSDSTGQAVLTLTQGASTVDMENAVFGGTGITVSSPDSTGAVTITNDGLVDLVNDTTPQLGGELDGQGNTVSDVNFKQYTETVHALGSTDTPTIDLANGNVQTVTISSGLTLPTIDNMPVGGTVTLVVSGSGTASGGADSAGQTYKFAGGNTTLTTLSIISIFYDGTDYLASIATDFQ